MNSKLTKPFLEDGYVRPLVTPVLTVFVCRDNLNIRKMEVAAQ
jgi:inhibitor of KinA sporulation pathway (predicted exonuclease)